MTAYPSYTRLFIWPSRLLYFGLSQHLTAHAYATAALHIGLYQPFQIKIGDGKWQQCRCAFVPTGIKHALNFGNGIHGKLFIERDSADFLYFKRRFPYTEQTVTLFEDPALLAAFLWIYEENPAKNQIAHHLDQLLNCDGSLDFKLDPRVQTAINLICEEPGRNFSQEYLATISGLSASRFLHLFKENTDVPYRRFRAWKRLFLAIEFLNSRDNMTYAALEAGFSDATHFSHSFREMFGVNPRFVFQGIDRFEVKADKSASD
jgi:AraC-like DNA-binding protein